MTISHDLTTEELRLPPLEDFLATNLRGLYVAFTKSPEKVPRSKEELIEELKPHVREADFAAMVAKLEATQTYRHLYLYAFETRPDRSRLVERIAQSNQRAPICLDQRANLHYFGSCSHNYQLLRFAHSVKNAGYVQSGPSTRTLKTVWFRHAFVVAIKPDLGIVEIRFNGFDQTRDTPEADRIAYSDIAQWGKNFVEALTESKLRGLQLKEPVEKLLQQCPDEVTQKKNVSLVGRARVSLDVGDTDDDSDLNKLINDAFGLKDGSSKSLQTLNRWTSETTTLSWSRFRAHTRIDYTGDTPEIMFSWKVAEYRSIKTHDHIIRQLIEFTDLDYSNLMRKLAVTVDQMGCKEPVTVLEVSQRAGASANEALDFLLKQVSKNSLRMMFRVRTSEHLLDGANSWVESLSALPRSVQTMDGKSLDLSDPANVEVGFARAEAAQ